MKKIFNTLSIVLLLQATSYAQQPVHRATNTKIADVLAQQPAEEQAKFLTAMRELEGFTSSDIAALLQGLKPQGQDNALREYATNSYATYVMQPGKEHLRDVYAKGLVEALNKASDQNNKAYILEILRFCAKNESISGITEYLSDEYLADRAAQVLVAIGTNEAAATLNKALVSDINEKVATAIVAALGELKSAEAEENIISLLDKYSSSQNFAFTGLTALSKIASQNSYNTFYNHAKAVEFNFDPSNAVGLAIDYANALHNKGNSQLANKLATSLFKESNVDAGIAGKVAALELMYRINPKKQHKSLLKLAKDDNAILRTVALGLLGTNATNADIKKIASSITKLNPDAQETVLIFLRNNDAKLAVPIIEKNLKNIKEPSAKIAAYTTLATLNENNSAHFLIEQLAQANEEEAKALKELLLTSTGNNVMDVVNTSILTANEPTQIALLDILSKRANTNASVQVFELIEKGSPAVRLAAYKALPNVVNDVDFEKVIEVLGKAQPDEVKYAQDAAIVALRNNPNKPALVDKIAANISRSLAPSAAKFFPVFAGEGGAVSLQTVKNYAGADNPLKGEAIQALATWSNTSSLDELTALLRTEKEAKIFQTIFAGFIKQLNASTVPAEQKTILLRDAFDLAQTKQQRTSAMSSLKATNTYLALVFASKYLNDKELSSVATDVVMNIAMDNKEYIGADVRNWLEAASKNLTGGESSYLYEAIVRHLAEMPRGEGYISLFNGQDLTGWKGLVENPIKRSQMTAKELATKQEEADKKMHASWSAINGELVFNGKGDNIATVKQYGDFELLLDWKLDKDGHEPDAGVYLRGTPQVQIWDISRVAVGADVGSGGLYNNKKHESKPSKVADNPLGEWNNFKIRMIGEKVSVWLNGELVVDNITLENYWDRNQSIFPIEQIELQAHGSTVWYRDIYIKEIPRKMVYTLSEEEQREGFEMLFDGTNLDKWTSSTAYEINEEGFLRSMPEAKFGKNIYTKEEYGDFIYRFEFKLTPGANNGVGIRAPLEGDAAYQGHEIQILDDDADVYKKLAAHQYHGSVYGIIPAKRGSLKPVGEWNQEEIRVQGDNIKVTVNGIVIVDGNLKEASKNGTLDKKNHPGLDRQSGHIGFLGHGTEVFLRNIRVKRL